MEPIRPVPLRPDRQMQNGRDSPVTTSKRFSQTRSSADLPALSRTASLLNFTGLESLKSSALFGIFERGGYETEPPTPDLGARHYDFNLADPVTPANPHEFKTSMMIAGGKLLGIGLAAFVFISLFNRIPNTNRFCAISSKESTHPFLYAVTACSVSWLFSFLDRASATLIPAASDISTPITRPNSVTNLPSKSSHAHRSQEAQKHWSFNILIRYFAGFLGLAYAGTKLEFSQSSQFNICVATVALCALGVLDRTLRGLMLSLVLGLVFSAAYMTVKAVSQDVMVDVFLLIWLNVAVYGSLGKMMRISERP